MLDFVLKARTFYQMIFRGFLLMGGLVALVAIVGLTGFQINSSTQDSYSTSSSLSASPLSEILVPTIRLRLVEDKLVIPGLSQSTIQEALTQVDALKKDITTGIKDYQDLKLDDSTVSSLFATVKSALDKRLDVSDKFIQNYKQLQTTSAQPVVGNIAYLDSTIIPAQTELQNAITATFDYNDKLSNGLKVKADTTSHSVLIVSIIALFIGPAIALYLGKVLSSSITNQIQNLIVSITQSSNQIEASVKDLENSITIQNASTTEVSAASRQIAATSKSLVMTMEDVTQKSQDTATSASSSKEELIDMQQIMVNLSEATSSIADKLGTMSNKAANINSVVSTITKVAVQTNLLSLNAAIEAEKAGEYGAGFSVVAREIRRLADQTAVATLEIEQMVNEMQVAVSSGVMEMDKFNAAVNESVNKVGLISNQTSGVIEQVQTLTPRFVEVSESMQEQSKGASQINESIQQLTAVAQQSTIAIKNSAEALADLEEASGRLRAKISGDRNGSENS